MFMHAASTVKHHSVPVVVEEAEAAAKHYPLRIWKQLDENLRFIEVLALAHVRLIDCSDEAGHSGAQILSNELVMHSLHE